MAPALAALVVCLTAPTAFDGLDEFASLAYCSLLYLVVRAWATTHVRRQVLLLTVTLVGLEQFTQAYLPWWGGGDVARKMTGTFGWHNQYAAFVLATGLVAGVLAVRGTAMIRRVGWLVAPWCLASVLFSGSRANLGILLVCWILLVLLSVADRRGRIAALAMPAVVFALASLLTSPLLMERSGQFSSTVEARQAEQDVAGNGETRILLWMAATQVGLDHPVTGAGFDSFSGAGSARMPADASTSTYVHNGYLQAFSDGGLLLLATLTGATAMPMVAGLRLLWQRRHGDDVLALAVPVAMLALLMHSGVDFDWAYPALGALFAVLAALVPTRTAAVKPGARRMGPTAFVIVLTLAAVAASVRASAMQAPGAQPPVWARSVATVVPLRGSVDWLPAASVCRRELASASLDIRSHGLRCSAEAAANDPGLELRRALAQVLNGREAAGLRRADAVVEVYGDRRPMLRLGAAAVLHAAGRHDDAHRELSVLWADLVSRGLLEDAEDVDRVLDGLDDR